MCCPQSGAGTRSKLFSVNALSVLLGKARRHPLVLGAMVKRGARPGAGTSLAGLNNSRCCSLIGCYGISEPPFIASDKLMRAIFLRSSLTNDCERSELRIIEAHYASRPDDLWGRPETTGTSRKWRYVARVARVNPSSHPYARARFSLTMGDSRPPAAIVATLGSAPTSLPLRLAT